MSRIATSLLAGLYVTLVAAGALTSRSTHAAERALTVFAAASLTDVLQEVATAFTAQSATPVRFSFAGSATLARQIEAGAPADAFVSADQRWMDYLAQRSLVDPASRIPVAGNALVLVAPRDSRISLVIRAGFPLAAALGSKGRLATGDPDIVPVGRYASAALRALGVWDSVAARLVPAESVRAALNFVVRGEAALGVVYATDLRGVPAIREVARFPADSHPAITYPAAVTPRGGERAVRFVQFLRSAEARAIFERHGFLPP